MGVLCWTRLSESRPSLQIWAKNNGSFVRHILPQFHLLYFKNSGERWLLVNDWRWRRKRQYSLKYEYWGICINIIFIEHVEIFKFLQACIYDIWTTFYNCSCFCNWHYWMHLSHLSQLWIVWFLWWSPNENRWSDRASMLRWFWPNSECNLND